ncbi:ribonuclease HI family protein [Nocardioides jejuensis]|uniref:ribonuclease H n=1 Tax=Nocardioides jejuensis TaxID=2502782 RepID=A0A4R1CJ90_9ACTN|nr:ribonuclease HI family protein [Nocardioides jejuensis]TCJ30246.1 ribonuclease HI family protein [Nocardioides jejuensis]
MTIIAAADGSALGNPGPSGWAWYVDEDHWASGGWAHGTNNMGELTGVLDLLQQTAHLDEDLLIYCDSRYAIDSITKWMPGWKRKGWKKSDGKPVMNVEIMKALDAAMRPNVRFEWVKGHAGHELNEAADKLANAAASSWKEGIAPDAGPGFSGTGGSAEAGRGGAHAAYAPTVIAPEPDLFGDDSLTDEEQVVALERSLLTPEVRRVRSAVAALLHPDWSEIGASGRRWTRDDILDAMAPLDEETTLDVVSIERLAAGAILLVWRSASEGGSALRSSLWLRAGHSWVQRFHQGTPEA